ncbi:hypothetical protein DDO01_12165 [Vibrio cholerae]|nr:hypothetical protein [Vibrio cholerae]
MAKDICATNKKSRGIFFEKNGGWIVRGEYYFSQKSRLASVRYATGTSYVFPTKSNLINTP